MTFHSLFSNGKMRRDNFIRVACSDFKEHFQFAFGKSVRRIMFSHRKSNLRWNSLLASMHAADCIYEILPQSAFEQVSTSSGIESLSGLDITFIRRQHDDASIRKFLANSHGRDDAIHLRHHQIHERYVGTLIGIIGHLLMPQLAERSPQRTVPLSAVGNGSGNP